MWGEAFVVYLRFGPDKGNLPLETAQRLARRWFPLAKVRSVIVDNQLKADIEQQLASRTTLIAGDNHEREFSGYEKGLTWLKRTYGLAPGANIILANDTFLTSYGGEAFLKDFSLPKVQAGLALGGMVGHVDSYPQAVEWEGRSFQKWVRTSLVVTKWQTLEPLLPLTLPYKNASLFLPNGAFFSPEAPLSEPYKEFVETWLFRAASETSPFKETWHSKEPLTAESRGRMQAKARCIFCEQTLSLRAQERQVPLIDPTRLSLEYLRERLPASLLSARKLAESLWSAFQSRGSREA